MTFRSLPASTIMKSMPVPRLVSPPSLQAELLVNMESAPMLISDEFAAMTPASTMTRRR